jgi:hypothetical protein
VVRASPTLWYFGCQFGNLVENGRFLGVWGYGGFGIKAYEDRLEMAWEQGLRFDLGRESIDFAEWERSAIDFHLLPHKWKACNESKPQICGQKRKSIHKLEANTNSYEISYI